MGHTIFERLTVFNLWHTYSRITKKLSLHKEGNNVDNNIYK